MVGVKIALAPAGRVVYRFLRARDPSRDLMHPISNDYSLSNLFLIFVFFSQFDSFIPLGLATFCFVSNLLWHRPGLLLADNCVYLAVASSHYTMGGTSCACFVSVMFDAMKMKDRDFGGGYSRRWSQTVLMGQI